MIFFYFIFLIFDPFLIFKEIFFFLICVGFEIEIFIAMFYFIFQIKSLVTSAIGQKHPTFSYFDVFKGQFVLLIYF